MKRVVIESPFAGDREKNHAYLLDCVQDCYARGEAPIASHLIGPLVLNDDVPAERKQGIEAGLAWHRAAEAVVFYTDLGWSEGMKAAHAHALEVGAPIERRSLPAWKGGRRETTDSLERLRKLAEGLRVQNITEEESKARGQQGLAAWVNRGRDAVVLARPEMPASARAVGLDVAALVRAIPALLHVAEMAQVTERWMRDHVPCESPDRGAAGPCFEAIDDSENWCEPCFYLVNLEIAGDRLREAAKP